MGHCAYLNLSASCRQVISKSRLVWSHVPSRSPSYARGHAGLNVVPLRHVVYDVISVVSARRHFLLDAIFHREEFKSQGMSGRASEREKEREGERRAAPDRSSLKAAERGKRPLNFENSADAADAEKK